MARGGELQIVTDGNRVEVNGRLTLAEFRRLLATMHNMTTKAGYEDLTLDFRGCGAAYPGPMLALGAACARLRRDGIECDLQLPTAMRLRNLFMNANWAHVIDPINHDESHFRGYTHVPVIQYGSSTEQKAAIDRMVDAVLCSLDGLERADLGVIEWSLNEITDNVLNHAESPVGGFVQLNNFAARKQVEFCVCDPGVGIPASLRQGHPELRNDTDALDKAVREGVTRDKKVGQGNGLYGTLRVADATGGFLHIHSGYARLDYDDHEVHIRSEQVPFGGTLVVMRVDCSNPASLMETLRTGGGGDHVEYRFEQEGRQELLVRLRDESPSFGSRKAGEPLRMKLANLVRMYPQRRIVVDFTDVPLVSSSFADEVFGKLFVEMGPLAFGNTFLFQSLPNTVRGLIDKAILQRSAVR